MCTQDQGSGIGSKYSIKSFSQDFMPFVSLLVKTSLDYNIELESQIGPRFQVQALFSLVLHESCCRSQSRWLYKYESFTDYMAGKLGLGALYTC